MNILESFEIWYGILASGQSLPWKTEDNWDPSEVCLTRMSPSKKVLELANNLFGSVFDAICCCFAI